MLKLKDGRTELYQWDTGRRVVVPEDVTQVHYALRPLGRSLDVDVIGGEADIPDVLLQTSGRIWVWAYVGSELDGYTKLEKTFEIKRRNKPADYVFTQPDQITLSEILERLGNVEETASPEKIGELVERYLAENPPVSGTSDAVQYTPQKLTDEQQTQARENIGAADEKSVSQLSEAIADKLDADKLREAVNEALAQAKESGEFDGDNGLTPYIRDGHWYIGETDTGVKAKGEDGKTPIKSVDYFTPEEVEAIVEDAAIRAAELVDVPEGGGTDISLGVSGASVGQIAKITAINDSGMPTAWEAVDLPVSDGGKTELIRHFILDEDVQSFILDVDDGGNPINIEPTMTIFFYSVGAESNTAEGYLKCLWNTTAHNEWGKLFNNARATIRKSGSSRSLIIETLDNGKIVKASASSLDNANAFSGGAINVGLASNFTTMLDNSVLFREAPSAVSSLLFGSADSAVLIGKGTEVWVYGRRIA